MKQRSRAWIIILAALAAAALLAVCVAMAATGGDLSRLVGGSYVTRTVEITENFRAIRIDSETEDIEFMPSPGKGCSVEFYERENDKGSAVVTDGTLVIGRERPRKWYEFISLFSFGKRKITVYLPEQEYGSLCIKESTGDVTLPGSLSFDSIEISVSTGDVNCMSSVSGRLTVSSSTGNILVREIKAGGLVLSSTTGSITIETSEISGDITANVSTGKVRASRVSCNDLSSVGSTGEAVISEVNASGIMTVERSTGNIRLEGSDAPELILRTSTGDITGSLLTEKVFDARSGTGRVDVPESSAGGICRINSSTGNIRITYRDPIRQ